MFPPPSSPRKDYRGDYAGSTLPRRPMPHRDGFPVPYDIQPYDVLDGNLDPLLQANNNTLVGSPRRIRPVQTMPTSTHSSGSDMSREEVAKLVFDLQLKLKRLKDTVGYHEETDDTIYERIDDGMKFKRREMARTSDKPQTVKRVAQNRGLYRIKFLIDSDVNMCSRIVLAILLTVCLALFCYQTTEHIHKFYRSPNYTSIDIRQVSSLVFPAVTICNLNSFKLTSVIDMDMYDAISTVNLHKGSMSDIQHTPQFHKLRLTYPEFVRKAAHRKEDAINTCQWRERTCTTSNFTSQVTDAGLCYSLSPRHPRTYQPGPANGLYLVMNIEQYEYMLGPRSSVGARIFIHDPNTEVTSLHNGVEVPVGKHTSIEVRKERTVGWNASSQQCSGLAYWLNPSCHNNCQPVYTCACDEPTQQHFSVAEAQKSTKHDCECPNECDTTEYKMFVSHAGMPTYGVLSLRKSLTERRDLEARIKKARDVYHRVDPGIHAHDTAMLRTISSNLAQSTTNASAFVKQVEQQENETKNLASVILDSVTKLNLNLEKNHKNLESNQHVSFMYIITSIHTKVENMAKHGDVAIKKQAITAEKKQAAKDAIILLTQIVKTDEAWYVQEPLINDVLAGLHTFTADVVKGYSKKYREFKTNKHFYEQKINKSLHITEELTRELVRGYYLLKNATEQLDKGSRLADTYLENFRRHTVVNAFKYLTNLSAELTALADMYRLDKARVLQLGKTLSAEALHMGESFDSVKHGLQSLKDLAVTLNVTIRHFSDVMMSVSYKYGNKTFGKTELSKKLHDNMILNGLQDTMLMTQNISTVGAEIAKQGENLRSSLETISDRLIDFNLTSHHIVYEQMRWLKFSSLHTVLASFWKNVQATLLLLSSYQSEIDDFSRGNKLDDEFYRNNFLQLEVYYSSLTETVIEQRMAYGIFDLACDLGGALALYLGVSILTAFDLIDFIITIARRPLKDSPPT